MMKICSISKRRYALFHRDEYYSLYQCFRRLSPFMQEIFARTRLENGMISADVIIPSTFARNVSYCFVLQSARSKETLRVKQKL